MVKNLSACVKAAFPERPITHKEAREFGEMVSRFIEKAKASGWTEEYVRSLIIPPAPRED